MRTEKGQSGKKYARKAAIAKTLNRMFHDKYPVINTKQVGKKIDSLVKKGRDYIQALKMFRQHLNTPNKSRGAGVSQVPTLPEKPSNWDIYGSEFAEVPASGGTQRRTAGHGATPNYAALHFRRLRRRLRRRRRHLPTRLADPPQSIH